jgi:hypothetical protein
LRLFGLALLAAAAVASCARLPSDPKVKAFGQAVEAAADIFKRTVDVHLELAQRLGDDEAAVRYVGKSAKGYAFPPKEFATIAKEALLPRRQLIDAIGGYGKALAEASDKGTIDQLEASAVTLATAAGTAVAPLLGGAAIPIVSPAARLVGRGIGLAAANAYATEVYAIVRRVDPVIARAAAELTHSIQVVAGNNRDKLTAWHAARRSVLDTIRDDDKVTHSVAYAEFKTAVAEARMIDAKIASLAQYKRVLDAMVGAHHGLTSVDPEAEAVLARFIEITKEVSSVIAAVSTTR